jgi:hypothetical protein
MRDQFLEAIALQRDYSSRNTPAMERRGEIIRREIPRELQRASAEIKAALGPHGEDLDFNGRDGTSRKTIIPWVRYFSKARSPSAQNGWYCVYLFDALGTGVYLELGHGSTTMTDGEYRPRPVEELATLVAAPPNRGGLNNAHFHWHVRAGGRANHTIKSGHSTARLA